MQESTGVGFSTSELAKVFPRAGVAILSSLLLLCYLLSSVSFHGSFLQSDGQVLEFQSSSAFSSVFTGLIHRSSESSLGHAVRALIFGTQFLLRIQLTFHTSNSVRSVSVCQSSNSLQIYEYKARLPITTRLKRDHSLSRD